MKKTNTKVKDIKQNSIAQEAGIEKGDIILSINGSNISDILEYKYLISDHHIIMIVQKYNGEKWVVEIEKDFNEDLGIIFENPLIDNIKRCRNKCIFCFIDQLPKNMRKTLYFKDDDYRLSFLDGNYISLTNVTEYDIQKIIKYRISPINISVHTTDPELRVKMLNNKNAGNINDILVKLASGGIAINCQIVVCPGINDEKNLDKTIEDLSKLFPAIKSIAVVPVGLTKYREGLHKLKPFDKNSSMDLINQIEKWQKIFKNKFKTNFVFIADEFYLMAQKEIPPYSHYEDFPQIENGIGLIAKFKKEFYDYLKYLNKKPIKINKQKTVSIVTGTSSFNFIKNLCIELEDKFNNIKVITYKVINNFFGESITVTGLVTGNDILEQLKGKDLGEKLIIPECMLRFGENVFLDNITINYLEEKLNTKIEVCKVNGKEFIKSILGR